MGVLLPPSLGIAGFVDRTEEVPLLCYVLPTGPELEVRFVEWMDTAKEAFLEQVEKERADGGP